MDEELAVTRVFETPDMLSVVATYLPPADLLQCMSLCRLTSYNCQLPSAARHEIRARYTPTVSVFELAKDPNLALAILSAMMRAADLHPSTLIVLPLPRPGPLASTPDTTLLQEPNIRTETGLALFVWLARKQGVPLGKLQVTEAWMLPPLATLPFATRSREVKIDRLPPFQAGDWECLRHHGFEPGELHHYDPSGQWKYFFNDKTLRAEGNVNVFDKLNPGGSLTRFDPNSNWYTITLLGKLRATEEGGQVEFHPPFPNESGPELELFFRYLGDNMLLVLHDAALGYMDTEAVWGHVGGWDFEHVQNTPLRNIESLLESEFVRSPTPDRANPAH
jgi:hypothetical protein